MYRWINLRNLASGAVKRPTNIAPPENYPDELTIAKNYIHVHGYSVSEKSARGENSEIFKRLHQSGSRARFVALTWFCDDSRLPVVNATPDYHENVINAFTTAQYLQSTLDGLSGEKIIADLVIGRYIRRSSQPN